MGAVIDLEQYRNQKAKREEEEARNEALQRDLMHVRDLVLRYMEFRGHNTDLCT